MVWTEVREPEVAIGVTIPSPIDVEIVVLVVSVADKHMGGSTCGGAPACDDDRPVVQQLIVEGVLVVVDGTFVQVQNTGILVLEEFQRLGDAAQIHWCGMWQIVSLERLTHISHQGGNGPALSGVALLKTVVVEHVCPVKRRALEGFHGEFACVGDISLNRTARFRILVMSHDGGKGYGNTSQVGYRVVDKGSHRIVGCIIRPIVGQQWRDGVSCLRHHPMLTTRLFITCEILLELVDGVAFGGTVVKIRLEHVGHAIRVDTPCVRIAQNRVHTVVTRHDHEALTVGGIKDIVSGMAVVTIRRRCPVRMTFIDAQIESFLIGKNLSH